MNKKTVVEAILAYLVFSGMLLIITKIWYPNRFQDTISVAIFAPITLLILAVPVFLAIAVWLKKVKK